MTNIKAWVLEFLAAFSCWFSSFVFYVLDFSFYYAYYFRRSARSRLVGELFFFCSRLRLHFVTHRSLLHSCLATSFTLNPASNKAKAWARLFTVSTLVQDVWFFTKLGILFDDVIDINVYITLWHHQRVHKGEDNCWYVKRKSHSIISVNFKQKYCF